MRPPKKRKKNAKTPPEMKEGGGYSVLGSVIVDFKLLSLMLVQSPFFNFCLAICISWYQLRLTLEKIQRTPPLTPNTSVFVLK